MRIGVLGPIHADSFADNIVDALSTMGHEASSVGAVDPALPSKQLAYALGVAQRVTSLERLLQTRIVKRIKTLEPELVVSLEATLLPETVAAIRAQGSKVVLWFPDCIANLGRNLPFVSTYDAIFFKEPFLVERARALLGAPVHYLPEACNPKWHKPPAEHSIERVAVVVGNTYPWRASLLHRLVSECSVPLRIYGSKFPRWMPSSSLRPFHSGLHVVREEKAKVFASASVVLNGLHPCEFQGVNARLFEATGSGAAVLSEDRPALRECFEVDKEVASFSTFDELANKIEWMLDAPDELIEYRRAASERAHREHSYEQRLLRMFDLIQAS